MRFDLHIELNSNVSDGANAVELNQLLRRIADSIVRNGVVVSTGLSNRQVTNYSGDTVGFIQVSR